MSKLVRCTLGDIGKVKMCKRVLKNQTSESGDIPFYKISTFGGEPSTFISRELFDTYKKEYSYPKKGDVLLSAAGTLGKKIVFNGEKAYFQDSNIVWLENDESKVLNKYLYYFYDVIKWKKTSGSTIDRLYNENILGAEIYYPDMATQKQIVNTLSLLDSKIENNNKIISELESLAKTIYDYWFLQFEFPNEDGKPYKSSGGKMVWNDELKREIPEGWEIHNISDLCTLGNGINYDKKVTGDKTYKIVNVRDISASSLLINKQDMNEISLPNELANKYLVNKGDILIARSGTPGAVRLVLDTDNVIYCGFIIHCLPNDLEDRFYLTFTLKLYEGTSATKTGGSILQNVSQDTLKSLTIPLPSKNILSSFNIKIKPLIDRMQLCIEENNQLASLRDFLLPMLMNGQVTFKEDE